VIIAVDFDGTIVKHRYPRIGDPVPGARKWLQKFRIHGARLILWTMRDGQGLADAVEYCWAQGIAFWGINRNPEQGGWTESPKVYAGLYIDDAAFGCPLLYPRAGRPYVDWKVVGPAVLAKLQIGAAGPGM
jgi:hypothetical protein